MPHQAVKAPRDPRLTEAIEIVKRAVDFPRRPEHIFATWAVAILRVIAWSLLEKHTHLD
jgi:hypothetical protein